MIERGFSLLECLLVIAIISIFLWMAHCLPSGAVADEKSQLICSQLLRAIQMARTEAIFRHHEVLLCGSDDGKTCAPTWRDHYIVLSDDKLITLFTLPKQHGVLHWHAFPRGRDYLQFQPNGYTYFQNGTFWYCEQENSKPRWAVTLSQAGLTHIIHPEQNDEIQDSEGRRLMCRNA